MERCYTQDGNNTHRTVARQGLANGTRLSLMSSAQLKHRLFGLEVPLTKINFTVKLVKRIKVARVCLSVGPLLSFQV